MKKVMIYGPNRTGTTNLSGMLNQSKDIWIVNEPFNPHKFPERKETVPAGAPVWKVLRELDTHYDEMIQSNPMVGCKHIMNARLSMEQETFMFHYHDKVIFNFRDNMQVSVLSCVMSTLTGVWNKRVEQEGVPVKRTEEVDMERFKRMCSYRYEAMERANAFAAKYPDKCFTLTYEQLYYSDEKEDVWKRLLEWLGVEYYPMQPTHAKLNSDLEKYKSLAQYEEMVAYMNEIGMPGDPTQP